MNLLDRLRSAAKGGHYPRGLATEAADEIERLRVEAVKVAASLAAAISILERASKEKK